MILALLASLALSDTIIVSDMSAQTLTTHTECQVTGFAHTPNNAETSLLLADCSSNTSRKTRLSPARDYSPFSYIGVGEFGSSRCNLVGQWLDTGITTYAFQCFDGDGHD